MSLSQTVLDAITRLKGYNMGLYNALTNALGISGAGGMAANWARHSKDLATVGEAVANFAEGVTQSADAVHTDRLATETAAAIATAAAGDTLWCGLAAGTANALVVTPTVTVSSLYDGLTVRFVAALANTAATTLKVGGAAVKPLVDPKGAPLAANALSPDLVTTATYVASSGHWRLGGGSGGANLAAIHAAMFSF